MSILPTVPTRGGFVEFLRVIVGIPLWALPDAAISIDYAFKVALALVNPQMNAADPAIYTMAVNNLATDRLINWAPDQAGKTYFAKLRTELGVLNFQAGLVSAASDESTSTTIEVIETLKGLTLGDLQYLKTPYGRQYLAFAMDAGTLWGMS